MADNKQLPPQLQAVIQAAQFMPSNRAIRARNAFWAQPGIQVPGDYDAGVVAQLAPTEAIRKLLQREWNTPGFQDWFMNQHWEKEEAQRLMNLSLQRLGEILEDEDEAGIVISAAKEAREVWTRLNGKEAEKFADQEINEMSKQQLEEFLRRNSNVISNIASSKK